MKGVSVAEEEQGWLGSDGLMRAGLESERVSRGVDDVEQGTALSQGVEGMSADTGGGTAAPDTSMDLGTGAGGGMASEDM